MVVTVLCIELHREKRSLLLDAPTGIGQLIAARAGVDAKEKLPVIVIGSAQPDCCSKRRAFCACHGISSIEGADVYARQLRGGKIPCRAMMKLNTR